MAIDDFSGHRDDQDDPLEHAFAITPGASELSRITRAIYVGNAGDLVVRFVGDTADITLVGVPAGSLLPFRLSHVVSSTAATPAIVGFR